MQKDLRDRLSKQPVPIACNLSAIRSSTTCFSNRTAKATLDYIENVNSVLRIAPFIYKPWCNRLDSSKQKEQIHYVI